MLLLIASNRLLSGLAWILSWLILLGRNDIRSLSQVFRVIREKIVLLTVNERLNECTSQFSLLDQDIDDHVHDIRHQHWEPNEDSVYNVLAESFKVVVDVREQIDCRLS